MLEPNIRKYRSHEEYSMPKEKYSLIDIMWTPNDNGKYLILIYCKRVLSQSFGPYMSSSLRSPLCDTNPNTAPIKGNSLKITICIVWSTQNG